MVDWHSVRVLVMASLTLVLIGMLLGVCMSALAVVALIDWRQDQRDQIEQIKGGWPPIPKPLPPPPKAPGLRRSR